MGSAIISRTCGGSACSILAVEEAIEHFGTSGPRLKNGTDGGGWWRGGEAGADRIHDDGVFQAKDGLVVEGSLVSLGLGFQHSMEMRRDVLQSQGDGVCGFHGREKKRNRNGCVMGILG